MPDDRENSRIQVQAQNLLRGGMFGSILAAASGRAETPIAVQTPEGRLHSWFVPVTVGNQLAGYFQFLPDLTLMGYSSFQRKDDSLDGCPFAESWTDPDTIRGLAGTLARPGETAGTPFLTYDRAPSRLAWGVPMTSPAGTKRTVLVAGQAVWESPSADVVIDSYGGRRHR
jgi:hypothetical protein